MSVTNSKVARQAAKRLAREGNRFARQKANKRQGPNVRYREGNDTQGYYFVSARDGRITGGFTALGAK